MILQEYLKAHYSSLDLGDQPDFFQFFVCEQVMKSFDLSFDELLSGIVDGGDDGKADAIYFTVNGKLVQEDTSFDEVGKNPEIELYIVQVKASDSYKENVLDGLSQLFDHVFDWGSDVQKFQKLYNKELLEKISLFRDTYMAIAKQIPVLHVRIVYASQGDTSQVHLKVREKAKLLEEKCLRTFHKSKCSVEFLGARELLDSTNRQPDATLPLVTQRYIDCAFSNGSAGYVCFVNLKEFYKFISDENGEKRTGIFESNVRDYQGRVEVNKEISFTLEHKGEEDFWWLNNGVTILAEEAFITPPRINITNPQIVNGLQTSSEIYEYFKLHQSNEDNRSLLVRVIKASDDDVRDKIIHATNSQTQIPQASLRATEPLHRDIEKYFLAHSLFYDRRKNYYKNKGEKPERIISIPQLAQSFMAIALKRPNDSHARPSTLLSKDEDYLSIFSDKIPIPAYLASAKLYKSSEAFLRNKKVETVAIGMTNIRFYFMMVVASILKESISVTAEMLTDKDFSVIPDEIGNKALALVQKCFEDVKRASEDSYDKIAKGKDLVSHISEAMVREFFEPRTPVE